MATHAWIPDAELIRIAHPSTSAPLRFHVCYRDGSSVTFAITHATRTRARRIANEYGNRFKGGTRIVSTEWIID